MLTSILSRIWRHTVVIARCIEKSQHRRWWLNQILRLVQGVTSRVAIERNALPTLAGKNRKYIAMRLCSSVVVIRWIQVDLPQATVRKRLDSLIAERMCYVVTHVWWMQRYLERNSKRPTATATKPRTQIFCEEQTKADVSIKMS